MDLSDIYLAVFSIYPEYVDKFDSKVFLKSSLDVRGMENCLEKVNLVDL